jgi:uncharacterized protein with von Willebrand factor type A (vWA) domain
VSRYRYGSWRGGDDPLAAPFDVSAAVDRLGRDVLDGSTPAEAVRDVLRRGDGERRGLDELREALRRRREQMRRGSLDGALQRARQRLDEAVQTERDTLAHEDDSQARDAEEMLEHLPDNVAQAVRDLVDYDWRSDEARALYDSIRSELRDDVLRQQLDRAREPGRPADTAALKDLLGDLNALLDSHARGNDTSAAFSEFMSKHGRAFPENPRSTDELIDLLAQRAAAAEKMLAGLTPEQRGALSDLIEQALAGDIDLASQMRQLQDNLTTLRPGMDTRAGSPMRGGKPLGYVEAADAVAEMAQLDDLIDALGQQYPGASLDDIDVEAVSEMLGPTAAADIRALRRLERELADQGWVTGSREHLDLSAKAVRRLGQTALRRVLETAESGRGGAHDVHRAGAAGEPTGAWRAWEMGDEQPLDTVRTVQQALLRGAGERGGHGSGRVSLTAADLAVVETETRTSAAVALLVDLSFSMVAEGRWGPMKQTALALHHLVSTRFRQDTLQVVGFDRWARPMNPVDLAAVEPSYVQGTNLAHALSQAKRFLARHPAAQPIVLVVTDGEPTAHIDSSGEAVFSYPPMQATIRATIAEVDDLTRMRALMTVVMLGDDPGLERFVQAMVRRNGGRMLSPSIDRLGEYVVSDYLAARRGRR